MEDVSRGSAILTIFKKKVKILRMSRARAQFLLTKGVGPDRSKANLKGNDQYFDFSTKTVKILRMSSENAIFDDD